MLSASSACSRRGRARSEPTRPWPPACCGGALDEHHIRVDGTFPIDDFNEQFGKGLPQEDYHTLAGFVFGELGRAPESGDEVTWDGLRFNVLHTDGPRIERLEIEFLEHWEPEGEGEETEEAERKAS